MKNLHFILSLLFFIGILSIAPGCFRFGPHSQLEQAEELSRKGDYSQAIEAYRRHMQERLGIANRPEWENPYFYLILIGDIQLGQGAPEEALSSYQLADQNKVDAYLVNDRLRSLATWYEQKDNLKKAFDLLVQFRERDPLLFDAMLDRIGKEMSRREDQAAQLPQLDVSQNPPAQNSQ